MTNDKKFKYIEIVNKNLISEYLFLKKIFNKIYKTREEGFSRLISRKEILIINY